MNRAVLIGMKGCGKTTLGQDLARAWGCVFIDTDAELEQAYRRQTGLDKRYRDIYAEHGPAMFAELEAQVVGELADRLADSDDPAVVALGGRTALNPQLHEAIRSLGPVIHLDNAPEELYRRATAGGQRPAFLDADDPRGSFMTLHRQRQEQYEALADVTVNLRRTRVDDARQRLEAALATLDQEQS